MKPFKTRRRLAFVILVLGLWTFFEPLVTFSKPIYGRTQWSAWNIVSQLRDGRLLHLPDMLPDLFLNSVFLIPWSYLLMLLALLALCLPRPQKVLRAIGGIGGIISLENIWWAHFDFSMLFFKSVDMLEKGGIRYALAMYVYAAVLPAILYISINESLDS